MRKTIGILAHVDAGKTTLSEQILYHGGTLRKRGRVDHQDAFLDQDPIERARGITVFSDQAMFSYAGQQFTLIDTPGHVDFSSEMERAAQILDYAVLLVSAVEGVQGHTETIWHLLQRLHIPVLIFINKTDRVGADVGKVLRELKTLSEAVWNITENRLLAGFTDALAQELADFDDGLLERYLEQGYDPQQESQWMDALGD
ncbi:MAG: GTP-binding protein, partial [Clostridia bacterium]